MEKKTIFDSVISFRITIEEKKELDQLTQVLNTNKSEFLRRKMQKVLLTIKKFEL